MQRERGDKLGKILVDLGFVAARDVLLALPAGLTVDSAERTVTLPAYGDVRSVEFRVYGRDGEPCERCRTPIAKTRVGSSATTRSMAAASSAPRRMGAAMR